MKILITGAYGFIGKNLISELINKGYNELCFCGRDTSIEELEKYLKRCDFVFHLAGVNRTERIEEFMEGNFELTDTIVRLLQKYRNKAPIVYASSTQATLDNLYGKSKLQGEEILMQHGRKTEAQVFVYRLTNVFGKWCRPNYNSVVATFCHNIAYDIPIQIDDENKQMELVYIDDVVDAFLEILQYSEKYYSIHSNAILTHFNNSKISEELRFFIKTTHNTTLGELAKNIMSFNESRITLQMPNMANKFLKKLYSTYLSYLPQDKFSYPLKMNVDDRGSFTEFLKLNSFGQVSINISKPGITKGNHWHHTKNEKFLVVSGTGIIQFKKINILEMADSNPSCKNNEEVIEYIVSGEKLEVIDIPPGYTHNITNLGDMDMVTVMWANESFNPEKTDTYFLEV